MSVEVNALSEKGGGVVFNAKHGVWASYAVAGVVGTPPAELLYAGLRLPSGRSVQLFVNRETGLVVVDIGAAHGEVGNEVLRVNANKVAMPTRRQCAGREEAEHVEPHADQAGT